MNWTPPDWDYPASRFFRVLFSVVVCLFASLMLSNVVWSEAEGHYLHLAAGPLFLIFFVAPVFAVFILIATVVLYLLDRKALVVGPLNFKFSVKLVLFLVAGTLTGYFHPFAGAIFLFLLLYWFMTGRVAGRPGWSLTGFLKTKWDEKLYFGVVAFILGSFVVALPSTIIKGGLPVSPGSPPFQVEHEHQMNAGVKRAMRRFPDAQSCLEAGAKADNHADLVLMDWDKIKTTSEAEVCSFRLLHEWGGVSEASEWLEAQGFRVGKHFSSEIPYVAHDGTQRVDGGWSIRQNGPRFPTTGLIRRVLRAVPYGMGIRAKYSVDGEELLYLKIDYSTL